MAEGGAGIGGGIRAGGGVGGLVVGALFGARVGRRDLAEGNVAEEEFLSARGPVDVERAFDFEALNGETFAGVFVGAVFDGRVAIGAVEADGAELQAVAGAERERELDGAGLIERELVKAANVLIGAAIKSAGDDGEDGGFFGLVAVAGDAHAVGAG